MFLWVFGDAKTYGLKLEKIAGVQWDLVEKYVSDKSTRMRSLFIRMWEGGEWKRREENKGEGRRGEKKKKEREGRKEGRGEDEEKGRRETRRGEELLSTDVLHKCL